MTARRSPPGSGEPPDWIAETAAGCTIEVLVKVRSARSRVLGLRDGRLEVAIAAPPVDGAANQALRRTLAKHFGLPPGRVTIVAGERGRRKRVELAGADAAALRAAVS